MALPRPRGLRHGTCLPNAARERHGHRKGAHIPARPEHPRSAWNLGVQHSHDLKCPRVYHHDLVAHQEVLVAAPLRIDRHDLRRQPVKMHLARHACSDRDREVDVVDGLNMLPPDNACNPGALLGGQPRTAAGLTGGDLRPAFRASRLRAHIAAAPLTGFDVPVPVAPITGVDVPVAVAAITRFGVHALTVIAVTAFASHPVAVLTALGLHALAVVAITAFASHAVAILAAFSLHILAALAALVIRAHAVRLLAFRVFAAFAPAGRLRSLVGLAGLHAGRRAARFAAVALAAGGRLLVGLAHPR